MDLLMNYSIGHSIDHFISKKCHVTVWFTFLNLTIISSVILSVYIDRFFSSVYLGTNFTIRFIPSVNLIVKFSNEIIQKEFKNPFNLVIFGSIFTDILDNLVNFLSPIINL
jgi:hypothetical protein